MTVRAILTGLTLVALALTPNLGHAQDNKDNLVKIRLVPEFTNVKPGQQIWIGIEQSIAPGWHTYWRNPGDSGTAPRVKWTLPQGFEIGEIQWPVPHKMPYGPLLNYGYEDSTILLQQLKVPLDLPDGPLGLTADVEVLVCKEECIPEYGTYELTLNYASQEAEDNSAYFQPAQRAVPGIMEWTASFNEKDGQFLLEITPDVPEFFDNIKAEEIEFFPMDWGLVDNTAAPSTKFEDGKIILSQKRGDRPLDSLSKIGGVIAYKSPTGKTQSFEFAAAKMGAMAKVEAFVDNEKADSIWAALFFALVGGLILNLMPCVFPVLSIKALSLVKIAEKSKTAARLHGLSYTAGVVLSFVAIAAIFDRPQIRWRANRLGLPAAKSLCSRRTCAPVARYRA
jgi:DsbC/DsbD-like thiol-disulfide interchange protein